MMKGIPLEKYLQNAGVGMNDDELEAQLTGDIFSQFNGITPDSVPAPSTSAPAAVGKADATETPAAIDINALLADALDKAEDREAYQEQLDTAVKVASHGVKVLSPLLIAASKLLNPEQEPEKLDAMIGSVLQRVRQDSIKVIEAYGVPENDAPPWLVSQVSGQVMQLLVAALERNNGAILEKNDIRYLQPLIDNAAATAGIGQSYIARPSDGRLQLYAALTTATAEVMSEYAAFDYFHTDPQQVAQIISEYLNERVLEGTLGTLEKQFQLNPDEVAYIGLSLIHQAGRALAESWAAGIPDCLDRVKAMGKDIRREIILNGVPLDPIFERFESIYQGVEIASQSAFRALSPGREVKMKDGARLG